jgi:hypothetical protein
VDACLLAVSHDTALKAARQIMPCPVVGMTEAACLTACLLGGRFGLLAFGGVEAYPELVARHGLAGRLAGAVGIAAPPPEAIADPEGVGVKVLAAVDPAFFALHGIDLGATRLLANKAKNHFRAAFAGRCAAIMECGAPSPAALDLAALPWRHVPREWL